MTNHSSNGCKTVNTDGTITLRCRYDSETGSCVICGRNISESCHTKPLNSATKTCTNINCPERTGGRCTAGEPINEGFEWNTEFVLLGDSPEWKKLEYDYCPGGMFEVHDDVLQSEIAKYVFNRLATEKKKSYMEGYDQSEKDFNDGMYDTERRLIAINKYRDEVLKKIKAIDVSRETTGGFRRKVIGVIKAE